MSADTVDITDPDLFARGGQHAAWRALLASGPVHRHPPTETRRGFVSVLGHVEVSTVLADHRRFTSTRGTLLNILGEPDPAAGYQMAATDPPRHDRMRRPLNTVLGMSAVRPHSGRVRAEIAEMLTPLDDGETVDIAVLLRELPFLVLGPMLGIPAGDRSRLVRLVLMCSAEDDPDFQLPGGAKPTLTRAHRELFAYFSDLVSYRRRHPGDDLVGLLLAIEVDGQRLSPGAVVSNCYSLLLGATATTPHVPTTVLAELVATGAWPHWSAAARTPDAIGSVVEEALRFASPAAHFMRHATVDVELGGVRIAAGEPVVAWLGAANRDAHAFVDAHTLNWAVPRARHVTFGAGQHYCLGAPFARLVLTELFTELANRFEGFELAGPDQRYRSAFLSGFKHLPMRAAR